MNELYVEFGRRLRKAREDADLTQAALGRLVGLSRTSITNIEAGRQQVALHAFMAFARAVGAPPSDLLPNGSLVDMAPQLDLVGDELRWFQRITSEARQETSQQHAET